MNGTMTGRSWQAAIAGVALAVALTSASPAAAEKTITFAGTTWTVKNSSGGLVGPGPNFFSDSASNVWVDSLGRLHLKITKSGKRWYCAEVTSTQPVGYGTYTFKLASAVNALDPNAVLGLFTYGDDDHEIDIEFSRWGRVNNAWNAQFVVQPWQAGQLFRWNIGPDAPTTHTFTWTPYAGTPNVQCMSIDSAVNTLATASLLDPTPLLQTGQYLHMNLWLFEGKAPRKEVEVVISDVRYVP